MNEKLGHHITNFPTDEMRPEAMNIIIRRSGLDKIALYETWNMGIGLVIACSHPDELMEEIKAQDENCMILGKVTAGSGLRLA